MTTPDATPLTDKAARKPFKIKEFAEAARVTPNAVYQMVKRGEVPFVRFGRAIRIPREAGERRLRGEAA